MSKQEEPTPPTSETGDDKQSGTLGDQVGGAAKQPEGKKPDKDTGTLDL